MADETRPLSAIVDELQSMSGTKDNELFTGTYFQGEYGYGPSDDEVAYLGGDIQTAYSNIYTTYEIITESETSKNEARVGGGDEREVNPEVVAGYLENAIRTLKEAINRIENMEETRGRSGIERLKSRLEKIRFELQKHKTAAESSGMFFP